MSTYDYTLMGNIFQVGTVQIQDLISDIKQRKDFSGVGSILTFTGTVRDSSLETTKKVQALEIDSWDEKTIESLTKICLDLQQKHNLITIKIWHAVGILKLTEDIVYVVVASAHRKEGLLSLAEAIDAYKHLSPIWKKEIYEDGTTEWISDSVHK